MSKSIHTTYKHIKGLSKIEIDKQLNDPNSFMSDLAKKSSIKKKVIQIRKQNKQIQFNK